METSPMVPLILALTTAASAEEPSYMDLFGAQPPAAPQPPATASRANRPGDVRPPLQPNPAPNAPPDMVMEPEPLSDAAAATGCPEVMPMGAQDAQDLTVDEPTRSPIAVDAGLTVASHYFFRGSNYFGGDQQATAALIAPSLTVTAGPVSFGWWGAFQGSGPDRESVVRSGSGHEQDLWVAYGASLNDRVDVAAGLYTYTYPWGREKDAGADSPFWIEPNVSLAADLGVQVGLYAAWRQGVQSGISRSSYAYFSGSIANSTPLSTAITADLGANLGAKALVDPSQWTGNTLDATMSWGFTWSHDALRVSPAGHLAWTNLPSVSAGQETTLWFGVDTTLAL